MQKFNNFNKIFITMCLIALLLAIGMNGCTKDDAVSTDINLQLTVQLPVNLRSAAGFVVLAGSLVSDVSSSAITGDIGLSPGSRSLVTGFSIPEVTGTIYAADDISPINVPAMLTTAKGDLTTAYNDAAGRSSTDAVVLSGNIGGLTFTPGLYKSNGSLEISSNNLTFDAKGDTNAVFVIQVATTLTTTADRQVILTNGAKARNIFWQVGTSATLGATSVFKGTIMAAQSIAIGNRATVEGRLLARVGGVTLSGNTLEKPSVAIHVQSIAQSMVNLRTTNGFAILAGTLVSDVSASNITGDVGLSPSGRALITGLTVLEVSGTMYASDDVAPAGVPAMLATAKNDLTTAYNDAAGRASTDMIYLSGNIGGMTLTPGLYKASAALDISTDNLTLNGRGDTNAVFIIQMAYSLTVTSGLEIILTNGAKASNIFWKVGTSASLGSNSVFKGTIMATQSIEMLSHATIEGRLLARSGEITLVGNTVVKPMIVVHAQSVMQSLVNLRSTENFVILAGSTVSNVPTSSVTGDIGLSPAFRSSITGFGVLEVTGSIFAANDVSPSGVPAMLVAAKADLTTAFNDATGRASADMVMVSGNLGGLTLTPGLYKSSGTLEISSGNLTFNARGDTNAVFIIQMAYTLTTTTGRQVLLTGGAKASNIFWQVGTSATLGANTVFKGTIMAAQSIVLNSGATVEGRLFASVSGVTLTGNTIVKPAL